MLACFHQKLRKLELIVFVAVDDGRCSRRTNVDTEMQTVPPGSLQLGFETKMLLNFAGIKVKRNEHRF